jgi:hypothetical protein
LRVGFRWAELPGTFRVCSVMGLIGGTYQTQLLSPLLFLNPGIFSGPTWVEGPPQVVLFYSLVGALVAALPVVSVGGSIGLLTLPMSEDHRGILAFLVLLSSVYPMLALAFNLLNFTSSLLTLWPFLIFAVIWVVLVYLIVKALRVLRVKSRLGPN